MFCKRYTIRLRVVLVIGLLLGMVGSSAALGTRHAAASPNAPDSYPTDPKKDIPGADNIKDLATLQTTFNNARAQENSQLGTNIPALTVPSQAEWDAKNSNEKALWLINRERLDRGVHALHGVETNVTGVAQAYASFLLANNKWGHTEDGRTPWERLEANSTIGACHDFLEMAENLYVAGSSANSFPMGLEQAVYSWMYEDAGSRWGHRHAILWYPYEENGGAGDKEGFGGSGIATGGPYSAAFGTTVPYAQVIVMNVFDPCANWDYGTQPPPVTGPNFLYLSVVRK